MKPGSGDDPFADDEPDVDRPDRDGDRGDRGDDVGGAISVGASREPTAAVQDDEPAYVLRRSTVKDERNTIREFYLRDEFVEGERELKSAVENALGADVSKFDLREAAYAVAQRHPDEVAALLEAWGYEYK